MTSFFDSLWEKIFGKEQTTEEILKGRNSTVDTLCSGIDAAVSHKDHKQAIQNRIQDYILNGGVELEEDTKTFIERQTKKEFFNSSVNRRVAKYFQETTELNYHDWERASYEKTAKTGYRKKILELDNLIKRMPAKKKEWNTNRYVISKAITKSLDELKIFVLVREEPEEYVRKGRETLIKTYIDYSESIFGKRKDAMSNEYVDSFLNEKVSQLYMDLFAEEKFPIPIEGRLVNKIEGFVEYLENHQTTLEGEKKIRDALIRRCDGFVRTFKGVKGQNQYLNAIYHQSKAIVEKVRYMVKNRAVPMQEITDLVEDFKIKIEKYKEKIN